jgi:hypothetical protein
MSWLAVLSCELCVQVQAEGMTCRINEYANVFVGLKIGQRRAQGDCSCAFFS